MPTFLYLCMNARPSLRLVAMFCEVLVERVHNNTVYKLGAASVKGEEMLVLLLLC